MPLGINGEIPPNTMTAEMMSEMPPQGMANMTSADMEAMPPHAMAGMDAPMMEAMPSEAMAGMDAPMMEMMPPEAMAGMDGPMMEIGHQTTRNSGQIATVTAMVTSITMKSSTPSIMSTNVVMHFPIIQHNGMIRIAMAGEIIMRMSLGMNLENLLGQVS